MMVSVLLHIWHQVTDIMLQEKLYPGFARPFRRWWNRGWNRIILFWTICLTTSGVVIMVISTDWINWDSLNRDFVASNEISRSFLASFILVMDLLIVMQVQCCYGNRNLINLNRNLIC